MKQKSKVYYSWSKIKSYINCPTLFYWNYIIGLEPFIMSKGLMVGRCMARGFEKYRQSNDIQEALKILINEAHKPDSPLCEYSIDDPKRSIERITEIFQAYCKEYPDDYNQIFRPKNTDPNLPVEIKFEIPLDIPNKNIYFEGIIDALFKMRDGSPACVEDKTSSWSIGDSFFQDIKSSFQILWYLWAAWKMGLFENHIPKCIINGIYIHEKKVVKKRATGLYQDDGLNFKRDLTIKSTKSLERAHQDLINWIFKIEQAKEDYYRFPRNTGFCHRYGGCDFLSICELEGKVQERVIEANFKQKEERQKNEKD